MSHYIPKRQTFAFPLSRPTVSGAGGSDGTFIAVHNESLLQFKKYPEEWETCGIDSYAFSKAKIYSEICVSNLLHDFHFAIDFLQVLVVEFRLVDQDLLKVTSNANSSSFHLISTRITQPSTSFSGQL